MTPILGIQNHLLLVNIGTTLSGGINNFGYTLQINYLPFTSEYEEGDVQFHRMYEGDLLTWEMCSYCMSTKLFMKLYGLQGKKLVP
jgi:hypothetical protein